MCSQHAQGFPAQPVLPKLIDMFEILKNPPQDEEATGQLFIEDSTFPGVPTQEISPIRTKDISRMREDSEFQCPVCGKKYRWMYGVVEHMKQEHSHKGVPRYQCSETTCLRSYGRSDALTKHQKAKFHHGSKILLEPNKPKKEQSIPIEIRLAEDSLRYKCNKPGCEKSYSSRFRCIMHMNACQSNCEKPFTCPVCPKAYAAKDCLIRHKDTARHYSNEEKKSDTPEKKLKKDDVTEFCSESERELVKLLEEIN